MKTGALASSPYSSCLALGLDTRSPRSFVETFLRMPSRWVAGVSVVAMSEESKPRPRAASGGSGPRSWCCLRGAVRDQCRQQRGHRPAAGPLHRPRLARRRPSPRVRGARGRDRRLKADVEQLTGRVDDRGPAAAAPDRRGEGPAGLEAVAGPGVTVTLSDADEARWIRSDERATPTARRTPAGHPGRGQRDVAGRRGGDDLQGQRIVSTTGIKCEGNAVLIQGVAYPQPYVISAIGSPADARGGGRAATTTSQGYRSDATSPTSRSAGTWSSEDRVETPAYDGLLGPQLRRAHRLTRAEVAAAAPGGCGSRRRVVGRIGRWRRCRGSRWARSNVETRRS